MLERALLLLNHTHGGEGGRGESEQLAIFCALKFLVQQFEGKT